MKQKLLQLEVFLVPFKKTFFGRRLVSKLPQLALLFLLLLLPITKTFAQGETWQSISQGANNNYRSVAYGSNTYVAVASNGVGNRVMTSPDGITWTARTSATDNNWNSVTYGNNLFVAVANTGTGNRVMTSPDGITWTARTSAADNSWYSVTYGNNLFVAVAYSGTGNRVMTSPDGINWTAKTSAADNNWSSVTYGNNLFVAVASIGTGTGNRVMTSPDGISWTVRTSAADNAWNSVTYGNNLFVAVAQTGTGNRVMTSPDGITWTSRTSAADNAWFSVTYGNNLFVAVAYSGTGNRVMTSPDGITWTARTSAADNNWNSVTYGNNLFVAVAYSGTGNRVMTSPDGITWTARTSAADNQWNSVTYGNNLFVVVAGNGTGNRVMTSPDGINWTARVSAADNIWTSVTFGNGKFVAVASSGVNNRVMVSACTPPAPTATGLQNFCGTATVANLTPTSTASATIKWYDSANATTPLAATTTLTASNYFATQTNTNGCESTARTAVTVVLSYTTYASNAWSNGTPDSTKGAIFASDFTASTNLTACSVSVSGTANVVFPSNFNLTVNNEIIVGASSTLTFENNSNLIQINSATNTGNIVYKRNAAIRRLEYTYWSSPVANQNLLSFTPNTLVNRFYTYSEPTKLFVQVASPSTTNFEIAKGYALRAPNNYIDAPAAAQSFVGIYTGVPNNGNITIPVTFTASPTGGDGYNLVGNPYPSTVSGTAFLNANAGSMYFWTHQVLNAGFSNYATFNLSGAAAATAGGVGALPNGFIQAGQGFMFLSTINKNVTFTNAMREVNNAGQFFRTSQTAENNKLWLNLTNDNGVFSQTLVAYLPNTTAAFDDGYDAKQINKGNVLSSKIGSADYAIQSRGSFDISDVVKLNLNITTAGSYTLSKDNTNGIFANSQDFFLRDNLLGTTHNIKQSPYNFVAEAGNLVNRFEIVYQSALSNQNNIFSVANVIVFEQNNLLNISSTADFKAVKVFDIQGRNIFEMSEINAKTATLNNFIAKQQVLMVQITNANNEVVTKKIIF